MFICTTEMLNKVSSILSNLVEAFLGPIDGVFWTLVIFWMVEYITDFCVILIRKRGIRKIGIHWVINKIGIICVISLSTYVDRYIMDAMLLRNAVLLYYISNSGLSILKNLTKIGVPIPQVLKDTMQKLLKEKNIYEKS